MAGLSKGAFWTLNALAGVALVLVIANVVLSREVMALRDDVSARQQYINQTVRLSRVNVQLIQALANAAARTGDTDLRALLAAHGISFTVGDDGSSPAGGTGQ